LDQVDFPVVWNSSFDRINRIAEAKPRNTGMAQIAPARAKRHLLRRRENMPPMTEIAGGIINTPKVVHTRTNPQPRIGEPKPTDRPRVSSAMKRTLPIHRTAERIFKMPAATGFQVFIPVSNVILSSYLFQVNENGFVQPNSIRKDVRLRFMLLFFPERPFKEIAQ